jgi:hypothetical protein
MIDQFKPGQTIQCTVKRVPNAKAARDTIARLMRLDPENIKSLRAGQNHRKKANNPYIRGNRMWVARVKAAKVVRVDQDATWSMPFLPVVAPDLASVASYLDVKAS